jgi:hypothetical protein
MSKEQIINDEVDVGEVVFESLKIKDEEDVAASLVAHLPYYYLFTGEQMKHSKIEGFLNGIDSKTGLTRRVLAARLVYEIGSTESKEDMSIMFIEDSGEKFTQIGFDKDEAPVILIDTNFKRPRLTLFERTFGTHTLKFTSEMLLNIFDTFVNIQKYRDENVAKNQE